MPVARTVTPDGDVILLVSKESAAARAAAHAQDADLPAVIEITDVAPVSVPHRIRGRAWLAGWLTPVRAEERAACAMLLAERHPVGEILGTAGAPSEPEDGGAPRPAWVLLRLEVGEIGVDDLWGAEHVDPDDFAEARPDPLVDHEAELLQHLHSAHGGHVQRLVRLLGVREERGAAAGRAVPVALDRLGLRIRFTGERPFDARFDFVEPVRDVCGLRRAMHHLFEAAAPGGH